MASTTISPTGSTGSVRPSSEPLSLSAYVVCMFRPAEFGGPVAVAFVDIRRHAHRTENGDADAVVTQILRQTFGERYDGGLGNAVRTEAAIADEPGEACREQDMPALLLLDHPGYERFDTVNRAPQIDVDGPLPVGMGHRLRRPEHRDAGIVEDDMNRAETRPCVIGESFHRRLVGHVGYDADRLRTVGFERRHGFAEPFLFDVRKHELDTLAGQGARRGEPDAARAAGDDGSAALEFPHCVPPTQILRSLFPAPRRTVYALEARSAGAAGRVPGGVSSRGDDLLFDPFGIFGDCRIAQRRNILRREHPVGPVPLSQQLSRHRDLVDLGRAVGEPHVKALDHLFREGHIGRDAERAMQVQGAGGDIVEYLRHQCLDGRDILPDREVILVFVDLPGGAQHEQTELFDLHPGIRDLLLHHLLVGEQRPLRFAAQSPVRTSIRTTSAPGRSCASRDESGRRPGASARRQTLRRAGPSRWSLGTLHIIVAHIGVSRFAMKTDRHVANDLDPRGLGRDDEGRQALIFRRSGSVTAITMKKLATWAWDENHFSPLITHSSPTNSARVVNTLGSAPPCGSVIEKQETI